MKTALSKVLILGLMLALLLVSVGTALAQIVPGTSSTPTSARGIVPLLSQDGEGGNTTCAAVGDYEFSSERFDDGDQYAGTAGPITWWTVDNTYVSWSGTHGGLAVIVKGGPASNVYIYDGSYTYDSGLASPPVGVQQNPADLSNITFCWNPEPTTCEWDDETAWAAGNRYVTPGNWATYTAYDGSANSVTLFAGQTMVAGTVDFSAPVNGEVTITITLNDGWRFREDDENVKIQDYDVAPSGNPSPGQFEHKGYATASPFSITVPANSFYGVHVDVEWEKCD